MLPALAEGGQQVIDRADRRLAESRHTVGVRSVHRPEHLALAGVDDRHDETVVISGRLGERLERGHRHNGDVERHGECLRRGDPDPHTREEPRSDIDGNRVEVTEFHSGVPAGELHSGCQGLAVATPASDRHGGEHSVTSPERDSDGFGGGLDPEDQHDSSAKIESRSRSRSQRPTQRSPVDDSSNSRRSSDSSGSPGQMWIAR